MVRYLAVVLFVAAAWGQQYEIGADVGYGIYHDGTVFSTQGTAAAGILNRFAAGIVFGDEFSDYASAELQYLYQDGHPFLRYAGTRTDIQGNSEAVTYSFLFHFKKQDHRWRPFLEGGMGAKGYIIAGPAPNPQPIPQIATLTANDVWKVVFVPGAGIQLRVIKHMDMRVEFRDYLTTFPRSQIMPAAGNTARGIFQQFTPLFGIAYTFQVGR
ncbi:MAG TPA: outer membrane beta-barrel protein [Verrucomicrobiae bacterium]|nr:outer membrane beta-barrel protein [Verrucomicrobiae bacterium]